MPGKRYASIKCPAVYRALKRKGMTKTSAAKISNAMARKGRCSGGGGRGRKRR